MVESVRWLAVAKWLFLALVAGIGVASAAGENALHWIVAAVAVYALPVLMQLPRRPTLRVWGIWLAVFLALHFAVSVYLANSWTPRLPPLLERRFVFEGDVVPGFHGVQVITTDAMGYRTTVPVRYHEKPPQTLRVFAIGGSTTEQILVDDRKTWPHLLQEELGAVLPYRVEVINTGVSGLRAQHHLNTLRQIARFSPDVVLIMVGANDWNLHIRKGGRYTAYDFFDFLQAARFTRSLMGTVAVGFVTKAMAGLAGDSGGKDPAVQIDRGEWLSRQNDSLNRPVKRALAIDRVADGYAKQLDAIAAECRSQRLVCVFVTQANAYREGADAEIRKRFWMTPPYEPYTLSFEDMQRIAEVYNRRLTAAAPQGTSVCDIVAAIPPSIEYFYDELHFNEEGSRRVAKLLAQCLLADRERLRPR